MYERTDSSVSLPTFGGGGGGGDLVTEVVSNSLWPHGLGSLAGFSVPWNFPDKNTEVGCHFLVLSVFFILATPVNVQWPLIIVWIWICFVTYNFEHLFISLLLIHIIS